MPFIMYLFNRYRIYDFLNAILGNVAKNINQLTFSSFQQNSFDQISDSIYEHHKLTTPVLEESTKFQRDPKDVTIRMPTRGRYEEYTDIPGTKFEIVVPFSGDKEINKFF